VYIFLEIFITKLPKYLTTFFSVHTNGWVLG